MTPCRVRIKHRIAVALRDISKAQRMPVNRWLDRLEAAPDEAGDFQICDERGRSLQVKALPGYWLTWWTDGAEGQVNVLDLLKRS